MPKAVSVESKVVEFFRNAPIDTVKTVHGIVHGIVKERTSSAKPKPATTAKKSKAVPAPVNADLFSETGSD